MAKKKKENKVHFELATGKKARLINEACQLVRDIEIQNEKRQEAVNKVVEKFKPLIDKSNERLEVVKKEIGTLKDGEYATKKNRRIFVTTKEKRSEPTVEDTRTYLKSKKRGKLFDTIIKVQLTLLRKILTQDEINSITEVVGKTTTWKYE